MSVQQKLVSTAAVVAMLLGTSVPLFAAQSVARFGVSVTIPSACQIETPDGTGSGPEPLQETSVDCTQNTPFQMDLEPDPLWQTSIFDSAQGAAAPILTITY